MTATTSGSSTPRSLRNTIEPGWPLPNPPKYSSSASKPSRLSDSGISNELSKAPPIVPERAPMPTNTPTHANSTSFQFLKHH